MPDEVARLKLELVQLNQKHDADQRKRDSQFDADQRKRDSQFDADQRKRDSQFDADQRKHDAELRKHDAELRKRDEEHAKEVSLLREVIFEPRADYGARPLIRRKSAGSTAISSSSGFSTKLRSRLESRMRKSRKTPPKLV